MSAPVCNVPWPVCPDCLGEPLVSSGGVSRCPRCRRQWTDVERNPCPDDATAIARDAHGGGGLMCRSHAVRAKAMIIGATVEGLDDAALAVAASLKARDEETAAIGAADHARELAELEGKLAPLDAERRAEVAAFRAGTHDTFRAYALSSDDARKLVRLDDDDDD